MKSISLWLHLFGYGMLAFGLAGFVVSLVLRPRLSPGQRFVGYWLGADGAFTAASLFAARWYRNSRVTSNLSLPFSVLLGLEALGRLQGSRKMLIALRVVAALYTILWVVLMLTDEKLAEYSRYSEPLQSLLIIAAGALTIAHRVSMARGDLLKDAPFLSGVAFVVYQVPTAFLSPVAQFWMRTHQDYVVLYYCVRDGIIVMAQLLMIYAMILSARQSRLRSA